MKASELDSEGNIWEFGKERARKTPNTTELGKTWATIIKLPLF